MPATKFSESEILHQLEKYIESTYNQHYATDKTDNIQVLDLFEDNENEAFCKINAVKYLKRFGKKDGRNLKDLTKAAHYIVMMIHFAQQINSRIDSDLEQQGPQGPVGTTYNPFERKKSTPNVDYATPLTGPSSLYYQWNPMLNYEAQHNDKVRESN